MKSAAEKSIKVGAIILRYNAEAFAEIDGLVKKIIEDSAKEKTQAPSDFALKIPSLPN